MEDIRHAGAIEFHVSNTGRNRQAAPLGGTEAVPLIRSGHEFKVTPSRGFRPRNARLALLRTAYLAAFATYGHGYAFRDHLDRVRAQLVDLESDIFQVWTVFDMKAGPTERWLAMVEEPADWSGFLCVHMGIYNVMLPGTRGDVFDAVAPPADPASVRLRMRFLTNWPTQPEYRWDMLELRRAGPRDDKATPPGASARDGEPELRRS